MLGKGFRKTSFRSLASRFVAEIFVGAPAETFAVGPFLLLLHVIQDAMSSLEIKLWLL